VRRRLARATLRRLMIGAFPAHRLPLVAACAALTACSLVFSSSSLRSSDAGADAGDDAPADARGDVAEDAAQPRCDIAAPFTSITQLSGFTAPEAEYRPTLSDDELSLWFTRGSGGIWHARRPDRASVFGPSTRLVEIDLADGGVDDLVVSRDGLALLFIRPVGNQFDIFRATRASTADAFGSVEPVTVLNQPNRMEVAPAFGAPGEIYFVSNRAGTSDLWVARGGGAPVPVSELNTPAEELGGCLSADGLAIYFASSRTDLGTEGAWDVFVATRPTVTQPFSGVRRVVELATPGWERPGFLSADGCRLYFERWGSSTNSDLWVAERAPR